MLRQKAVAHCKHVQVEQRLAGTISVVLPDTSKAMQQQAGEGKDYPGLQVVK